MDGDCGNTIQGFARVANGLAVTALERTEAINSFLSSISDAAE